MANHTVREISGGAVGAKFFIHHVPDINELAVFDQHVRDRADRLARAELAHVPKSPDGICNPVWQ